MHKSLSQYASSLLSGSFSKRSGQRKARHDVNVGSVAVEVASAAAAAATATTTMTQSPPSLFKAAESLTRSRSRSLFKRPPISDGDEGRLGSATSVAASSSLATRARRRRARDSRGRRSWSRRHIDRCRSGRRSRRRPRRSRRSHGRHGRRRSLRACQGGRLISRVRPGGAPEFFLFLYESLAFT